MCEHKQGCKCGLNNGDCIGDKECKESALISEMNELKRENKHLNDLLDNALNEQEELRVENTRLKSCLQEIKGVVTALYMNNWLQMNERLKKENKVNLSRSLDLNREIQNLSVENAELKAENERLQEKIESYAYKQADKYLTTLQQIKAIVCGNYEIIDPQGRKDILKLITKAEEE